MANELNGMNVAILITDGFEQVEMTEPKKALEQAGARTFIVSPAGNKVKGWQHTHWGDEFNVDVPLDKASPDDYDALLLPGGVMSPDKLRMNSKAVEFVKAFFEQNKPVAAICHGPWTMVEANVVRGRTLTSWPSLQTDIRNAGGNWVDKQVVIDGNLVSSRKPDDISAFNENMVSVFSQGIQRKIA